MDVGRYERTIYAPDPQTATEPLLEPLDRTGLARAAPIVAFHAWTYEAPAGDFRLFSRQPWGLAEPWFPGQWAEAECQVQADPMGPVTGRRPLRARRPGEQPMHPAPLAWCLCGLHGMKSLSYLCSHSGLDFDLIATSRFGMLMGTVELAGKVVEYGYGYRAQFARLVEIAPTRGQEALAELAATIYGAPVSTVLLAAGTLQDIPLACRSCLQ